jgi:hypothetical protein
MGPPDRLRTEHWALRDELLREHLAFAHRLADVAHKRMPRRVSVEAVRSEAEYGLVHPGTFLKSVEDPTQFREVGAIVVSTEADFVKGTTKIQTGFAEMDFTLFR